MGAIFHLARTAGVDQRLISLTQVWAARCTYGVTIVSGVRTAEQQTALYAQGRTTPGNIVTRALPANAPHCHAGAIDAMPLLDDGALLWDEKDPSWPTVLDRLNEMAHLARAAGIHCGMDWVGFKDLDHFEVPYWRQLPLVNVT